jgi:hypothetical protein
MIEQKEIPSEFVSIRQIWLQNISRCSEAISNRAKPDASHEAELIKIGHRTVVYSVKTLYYTLVDYGEALIKTEVDNYKKNVVDKQLKDGDSWQNVANTYQEFFEKIIEVLNKYGMLFQEKPRGYSNVNMGALM